MSTLREAAQRALEALEKAVVAFGPGLTLQQNAITALRAALAEQERGPGWCDIHQHYKPCEHNTAEQAQPVAWKHRDHREILDADPREWGRADEPWIPLYTTPPAPVVPQPLTEDEIERLIQTYSGYCQDDFVSVARAVEAEVLKRVGVGK